MRPSGVVVDDDWLAEQERPTSGACAERDDWLRSRLARIRRIDRFQELRGVVKQIQADGAGVE